MNPPPIKTLADIPKEPLSTQWEEQSLWTGFIYESIKNLHQLEEAIHSTQHPCEIRKRPMYSILRKLLKDPAPMSLVKEVQKALDPPRIKATA